ncbi:hypothetical protein ABEB36_010241 [Hypothenemus hampei]|uniref:Integrin beta n=1 Tax=Hypothenemus hampei TaxID=57062 RepID=A0ABD1EJ01_HYPHA
MPENSIVQSSLFFLFLISGIKEINGQDCESKETCDQCVQELNCLWCISPKIGYSHCLNKSQRDSQCDISDIEDPNVAYTILEQELLTETQQISPQRVQLKLRKNQKYEIKFQYRQSTNYPIDLYYVMDVSHSMSQSKKRLAQLGEKLAKEMQRRTTNFRIGFGSFVDKLTLPFANPYLDVPCAGCAPTYNFINHLSLINNATLFAEEVSKTKMSGNLDTPEAGLDAIMQAIVCKNEIGWRSNARHLLVLSTDAVSHIAGDGKLGGVIEPNDATCHMENHTYTKGLQYDYPSLSQINYVARQNNINIIFAIVLKAGGSTDVLKHYQAICNVIENSKSGPLYEHSDDVVRVIADIYDEIRESVKMTSIEKKDVSVNISSSCPNGSDGLCNNLKLGQTVNFTATIEPLICQKNDTLNKKLIRIKPEGLEDQLIIDLEVICDCECASKKDIAHSQCSDQGDLECGICRCYEGRFGTNCHCDWTESTSEDPNLCVKPDGRNETCSGQGKCKCGKCECKLRSDPRELIYGKYCECDNFSCPHKCSSRGTCDCGKCNCENGWTGEGCDCSTDQSQCINTESKEICSGHGECVCGQCECKTHEDIRYSGKYCEECINCPAQRCNELKPCIECELYHTMDSTDCIKNCSISSINIVEKLDEVQREDVKRCRVLIKEDCAILFEYNYDVEKNLLVTVQGEKICPYLPAVWVYVLGVVGSVLLAGLVTLIIWKLLTTIHDKKEYARFLDERNQTIWGTGENPLYKPGTSHFANPVYNRSSSRKSVTPTKSVNN